MTHLRLHRLQLAALAVLVAVPVLAWATARSTPATAAPAWPAAPEPARVRWLSNVSSDRDAGTKRAWTARLHDALTGDRGRRLVRPVAVCAGVDGSLLVSDPATSTVYEVRAKESALRVFANKRLATPVGLARLANGDVWVADADRGVLVHFGPKGEYRGEAGGGVLVRPTGLAYDATRDRLYVADAQAHRVSVYDGTGRAITHWGKRGTADGEFNFPTDVKVAPDGDVIVCDAMNFRVQRLHGDGTFVSRFGEAGDARGTFARPKGVALDADGHLYVVDALHDVVQVFDDQGRLLLVVGSRGATDGKFNLPAAIAIGPNSRIYVADSGNHRVQVLEYLREGAPR